MSWIDRLKAKWNVDSNFDFLIIMMVFSIAGMLIVYERRPVFHWLGITHETPFPIKFFAWLMVVFPAYQINLVIFGFLFGQFRFFWNKERALGRFLLRMIRRR